MNIREFLQEKGPSLSSTIKNELRKEGLKDEAARQQISKARGGIYRLIFLSTSRGKVYWVIISE